MKLKNMVITIIVLIVLILFLTFVLIKLRNYQTEYSLKDTNNINVVTTLEDEITKDSIWSPTFELIWKDFKDNVAFTDITFKDAPDYLNNLNKSNYDESNIDEKYLYKTYGIKTLELKETIEKNIKEKFNTTSDILDKFDWDSENLDQNKVDEKRYFFYAMLYKTFEYNYEFKKLENSNFGKYENIKYFGTDNETKYQVRSQMNVLFYEDEENFAIKINTKNNDEVIIYKNPKGKTFNEIYNNLNEKTNSYKGLTYLRNSENFKMPYIDFKVDKEFSEIENKKFKINNPDFDEAEILKALETVSFKLDEKGGTIKSEAGMDVNTYTSAPGTNTEIRSFNVDSTFACILKEKDKKVPYFAMRVEDITKYNK